MNWLHDAAYFFGGAFLANPVPHFVSGVMGRPFQSPFAKPPGASLSSSSVNVLWVVANFVIASGLGALPMGVMSARALGRSEGGKASVGS